MAVATRVVMFSCSSASCKRQRVDDRRQHSHVVGRATVHAARARRQAPKQVAAADDDGDLHAELLDLADLFRDLRWRRVG